MKKIIFAAISLFFVSSEAEISITQYNSHANLFAESDRLVFGHILLKSGFLKKHRFFGPFKDGHFLKDQRNKKNQESKGAERTDGKSRSYLDQSDDPMTALVIKLFPSAGPDFNANGTGAIEFDNEDKLINFIANMFCIADYARNDIAERVEGVQNLRIAVGNERQSARKRLQKAKTKEEKEAAREKLIALQKKEDALALEIENEKNKEIGIDQKLVGGASIKSGKWNEIVKELIKAVQTEKRDEYPSNYTNYVISAYAWKKLSTKDSIKKLAERISLVKFIFELRTNPGRRRAIDACLQADCEYIEKHASPQLTNVDSIGTSSTQDNNSSDTLGLDPKFANKLKSCGFDLDSEDLKKLKSLREEEAKEEKAKEPAPYREWKGNTLQKAIDNPDFDSWTRLLSDISSEKLPLTSIVVNKLGLPVFEDNEDDVTTILFDQESKCESLLLTPFSPFMGIPKNAMCYFENNEFPDCAEVALRCLVSALFYDRRKVADTTDAEAANDWSNSFEIDLRGFKGAPICKFFDNNPAMKNVVSFINGDNKKIRDSWGALLAARPGVEYRQQSKSGKGFEIKAGWINILTALCNILLVPEDQAQPEQTEGTEKTAESKALEEEVQKVVKEALEGLQNLRRNSSSSRQSGPSTSGPAEIVKNTLKKLIEIRKIRGNSELIIKDDEPTRLAEAPAAPEAVDAPAIPEAADAPAAPEAVDAPAAPEAVDAPAIPEAADAPAAPEAVDAPAAPEAVDAPVTEATDKLSFSPDLKEVHGVIKICPKEAYETSKEGVNTLAFGTKNGHAFVNDIPAPLNVKTELSIKENDHFSWIKTLNNDGGKACSGTDAYQKITCIDLAEGQYDWILGLGCGEFLDAILTPFYDEENLNTTNFLCDSDYCFDLPSWHFIVMRSKGSSTSIQETDVENLKKEQKDFFRKIINRSKNASNVVFALRNLKMIPFLRGREGENIGAIEPINLEGINKEDGRYKILIPNGIKADVCYLTEDEFRILLDILRDCKSVDEAELSKLDEEFFQMLIRLCSSANRQLLMEDIIKQVQSIMEKRKNSKS